MLGWTVARSPGLIDTVEAAWTVPSMHNPEPEPLSLESRTVSPEEVEVLLRKGGVDPINSYGARLVKAIASSPELTGALIELIEGEWLVSPAEATTRLTRSYELSTYIDWCKRHGLEPLGVDASTVRRFLTEFVPLRAVGTLRRYCRSISRMHLDAGLADPTCAREVREVLEGAARLKAEDGTEGQAYATVSFDQLRRLVDAVEEGTPWPWLLNKSDAATVSQLELVKSRWRCRILIAWWASLTPRETLLATIDHVSVKNRQLTLTLPPSVEAPRGYTVVLPSFSDLRYDPVSVMERWIDARSEWSSDLKSCALLFPRVRTRGRVSLSCPLCVYMANPSNLPAQSEDVRFAAATVSFEGAERKVFRRIVDAAGLGDEYPPLLPIGLRWGVGQEATEGGADLEDVRRHTRFVKVTSVTRRFGQGTATPDDPLAGIYL